MFMRDWFHKRLRKVSLADFEHNELFEFNVMMVRVFLVPVILVVLDMYVPNWCT